MHKNEAEDRAVDEKLIVEAEAKVETEETKLQC